MTSDELVQPVLAKAFASGANATKTTDIGKDTDATKMNLEDGFPEIFSTLIKDGGKFIDRADINGILNLISKIGYYSLIGGLVFYDSNMANAINGYCRGARLWYLRDGKLIIIESQIDNNKYQPSASTVDVEIATASGDKVVWKSITGIIVDTSMSTTSTNAVQNRVIKNAIDEVDDSAVHKTGDETVQGTKTFTSSPLVPTIKKSSATDPTDNTLKAASTEWVQSVKSNVLGSATVASGVWNFTNGVEANSVTLSNSPIKRDVNTDQIKLIGATADTHGASLNLEGKDYGGENTGGAFTIKATNSDGNSFLKGTPSGNLTWTNSSGTERNVVRTVNGQPADANGNVNATSAASAVYLSSLLTTSTGSLGSGTVEAGAHGEYTAQNDCYLIYAVIIDTSEEKDNANFYLRLTLPDSSSAIPISYTGSIKFYYTGRSLTFCGPVKKGTKLDCYFGATYKKIHQSGYTATEFSLA